MNASKEVGEASGEEMGMGETMEDVVTSAVEAMEAMLKAVEMRESLEVGKPETERDRTWPAIHFFSRTLACPFGVVPLHWSGFLPGLFRLLLDESLLLHKWGARSMIGISALTELVSHYPKKKELVNEITCDRYVSDQLIRLVSEAEYLYIRAQVVWLIGRICNFWWGELKDEEPPSVILRLGRASLPRMTDLIHKYADIPKPTKTELAILEDVMYALEGLCSILKHIQSWHPFLRGFLPVLAALFKEPGNHKEAQISTGHLLGALGRVLGPNCFLENGVVGKLLETLRVGKETTAFLAMAVKALEKMVWNIPTNNGDVVIQKMLDMGLLGVVHQVLERPNHWDWIKGKSTLWSGALFCLEYITHLMPAEKREAILGQKGLLELILERSLGMELTEDTSLYHQYTNWLLFDLQKEGSLNQIRQLMSKESLFHFLARFLSPINVDYPVYYNYFGLTLSTISTFLERWTSEEEFGLRRRLVDSSGITDALRRISLSPDFPKPDVKEQACHILDTYLTHPLPPPPKHNLPSIIYTRNSPF